MVVSSSKFVFPFVVLLWAISHAFPASCPSLTLENAGTYLCCASCCRFETSGLWHTTGTASTCTGVTYSRQGNTLTLSSTCSPGASGATDAALAALRNCYFRYCSDSGVCTLNQYGSNMLDLLNPVPCPPPKSVASFQALSINAAAVANLASCSSFTDAGFAPPTINVPVPICTPPVITCSSYEVRCSGTVGINFNHCTVNQTIPLRSNSLVTRYEFGAGPTVVTNPAFIPCPSSGTVPVTVIYDPAVEVPPIADTSCGARAIVNLIYDVCTPSVTATTVCPTQAKGTSTTWFCTDEVPIFDTTPANSLCNAAATAAPDADYLINGAVASSNPKLPCPPPSSGKTALHVEIKNPKSTDPATCYRTVTFYLQDRRCMPPVSLTCPSNIVYCSGAGTPVNLKSYCTESGEGTLTVDGGQNVEQYPCPSPNQVPTSVGDPLVVNLTLTNAGSQFGDPTCGPAKAQVYLINTDCFETPSITCDTPPNGKTYYLCNNGTFNVNDVCRVPSTAQFSSATYSAIPCPAPTSSTNDLQFTEVQLVAVAKANNGGANCMATRTIRLKSTVCLQEPQVFGCNLGLSNADPIPCSSTDGPRTPQFMLDEAGCSWNQFSQIPSSLTVPFVCPAPGKNATQWSIQVTVKPRYGGPACDTTETVVLWYRNNACSPKATITCAKAGQILPCRNGQIDLVAEFGCTTPSTNNIWLQPTVIACPTPSQTPTTVTLRAAPFPNDGGQDCETDTETLQVVTTECTPPVGYVNCQSGLTNLTAIPCEITLTDAQILSLSGCTLTRPTTLGVTQSVFRTGLGTAVTSVTCNTLGANPVPYELSAKLTTPCAPPEYCDSSCEEIRVPVWLKFTVCDPAIGFTSTSPNPGTISCTSRGSSVDLTQGSLVAKSSSQFNGSTTVPCPASLTSQSYPLTVVAISNGGDFATCSPVTRLITVTNTACEPPNGFNCPSDFPGSTASNPVFCGTATASVTADDILAGSGCLKAFPAATISTPTPCTCPAKQSSTPSSSTCTVRSATTPGTGLNCAQVDQVFTLVNSGCTPALGTFSCSLPIQCSTSPANFGQISSCVANGAPLLLNGASATPADTLVTCPLPGQTVSITVTYQVSGFTPVGTSDSCRRNETITVKNIECFPVTTVQCTSAPIVCTVPGATLDTSVITSTCTPANGMFVSATQQTCPDFGQTFSTQLTFRNSSASTPFNPGTCEATTSSLTIKNVACSPFAITCSLGSQSSPIVCSANPGQTVVVSGITSSCSANRTGISFSTLPATINCPSPGVTTMVTVQARDSSAVDPFDATSCVRNVTVYVKNQICSPKPTITCSPITCTIPNQVFSISNFCTLGSQTVLLNSTVTCPALGNTSTITVSVRSVNATGTFDPVSCQNSATLTIKNIACSCRPAISCTAGVNYPASKPINCTSAGQQIPIPCTVANGSLTTTTISCPAPGVLNINNVTALSTEVSGNQPGIDYDPNTCASQVQIAIKNIICSPSIAPIICPSVISCTQAGVVINGAVLSQCSGGGTLGTVGISQCPAPGQNITITVTGRNLTVGSPFDSTSCLAANLNVIVKNTACDPPVVVTCTSGNTAATPVSCTGGTVNISNICTIPGMSTPAKITLPPNPGSVVCPTVPEFSQPTTSQIVLRAEALTNNGDDVTCKNTRTLFLRNNQCNPQIRVFCTPRTCSTSNSWSIAPCTTTVNGILIKNATFNFAFKCPTTPGQVQTVTVCARKNNTYTNDDPATCYACNSTTITNTDCITPTATCPSSISCTNGVLPTNPCTVSPSNAVQTFPAGTTCPGGRLCTTVTITSPGSGGSRCTITRNILLFGSAGGAEVLPDQLCNPAVNSCVNGFRCIAVNSGPDVLCAPGGSNCYCKPNPTCVPTSTTSLGVKGLNEQCGGGFGFCSAASVCGQEYCPRSICYACSAGTCTCQADGLFCYCK